MLKSKLASYSHTFYYCRTPTQPRASFSQIWCNLGAGWAYCTIRGPGSDVWTFCACFAREPTHCCCLVGCKEPWYTLLCFLFGSCWTPSFSFSLQHPVFITNYLSFTVLFLTPALAQFSMCIITIIYYNDFFASKLTWNTLRTIQFYSIII